MTVMYSMTKEIKEVSRDTHGQNGWLGIAQRVMLRP